MSIHQSLIVKAKMKRHRGVLSREERLEMLKQVGKWQEGQSIFSLPKTRVAAMKKAKGKDKKKEEETAEGKAAPAAEKKAPAAEKK